MNYFSNQIIDQESVRSLSERAQSTLQTANEIREMAALLRQEAQEARKIAKSVRSLNQRLRTT